MEWSRKKSTLLNVLGTRLRSLSSNRSKNRNSYLSFDSHHIRIPILVNTINVTQASTQTLPININNNNAEDCQSNVNSIRHKTRRRKYQHRFNKCLAELIDKYPPIPAHEYLKEEKSLINDDSKKSCYSSISNSEINSSIWSKLLESREDLSKLNKTLEDLDKRLECLSMNICLKCKYKD